MWSLSKAPGSSNRRRQKFKLRRKNNPEKITEILALLDLVEGKEALQNLVGRFEQVGNPVLL